MRWRRRKVQVTEEALVRMLPPRLRVEQILSMQYDAGRGILEIIYTPADEGVVEGADMPTEPMVVACEVER